MLNWKEFISITVQLLALHRTPKNHTMYLRVLSKHLLNSDRLYQYVMYQKNVKISLKKNVLSKTVCQRGVFLTVPPQYSFCLLPQVIHK